MSLEIKNLTKIYGTQKAVDDISFIAPKGEIVGFLGPNGAGKSTTMKISTGFLMPSSGSVSVCGINVQQNSLAARQKLGYLAEHNPLYLDMYVPDYLKFSAELHNIKGALFKTRLKEVIQLCGLQESQGKLIGQLSKGFRQRVGLAQALIHDPEVLILDEPTTGLDPNQIFEMRSVIKQISSQKTIVFSTHIMQEVQALCQRVVIINKGKIVANSTLQDLQAETSGKALLVTFVESIDTEKIMALQGVKRVEALKDAAKPFTYKLFLHAESLDLRAELFKLAVAENWTLLEQKEIENSLESIFKKLTESA
ncbi:MAG: gliding motility-associated ABC transporter ATP-binding subunit GldA [Cytophagales bacterium]|nr:MAG: gliding motility-associated ABC transporter ATP-binding subunit GldA [Cytophagales bacterium]TAF60036.1 MAG: gliding motility-associated ABC transporter ATP-binding subunit GldA [Cytophagales bacterium]